MKLQEDKDLVLQQLDAELKKDRTKSIQFILLISGLVEMTRKRVGRNLSYFYRRMSNVPRKGKNKICRFNNRRCD